MSAQISNSLAISRFRGAYLLSTFAFGGLASLAFISSLIRSLAFGEVFYKEGVIAFAVACVPLIPILRRGGVHAHRRLAWGISIFMMLLFGGGQLAMFLDFLKTQGEGPRGEGAPGAYIFGMVLFAILFFCPWLLTVLRGFAAHQNSHPS